MSDTQENLNENISELSKEELIKKETETFKKQLDTIKERVKDDEESGSEINDDELEDMIDEINNLKSKPEKEDDSGDESNDKSNDLNLPTGRDDFEKQAVEEMKEAAEENNVALSNPFKISDEGRRAIAMATSLRRMKHGIYAQIPIICHGDECPYSEVCTLHQLDKDPKKEQCPIEIAMMEDLIEKYFTELEIKEKDIIDASMVRNLISLDIQLMRANKKAAVKSDVVENVAIGVSEDGNPIYQPQISKAYEVQDILLRRRQKILKMLNATREAKSKDESLEGMDPSSIISTMKERLDKFQQEADNTIDISDDVEDVEPESNEEANKDVDKDVE